MVVILALAAAVLYGSADFLGGAASRRASAIAVLCISAPFGEIIVLIVALLAGGPIQGTGLLWGLAGGAAGGAGLIVFYAGLAAARMSVVAPITALVSTVLPVGVAVADGERPAPPRPSPGPGRWGGGQTGAHLSWRWYRGHLMRWPMSAI